VGHQCSSTQLHGFNDACDQAYAAVVYLRTVYSDGYIQTVLIASKTRVAPLKKQSVPRLEPLGTLIVSRLVATITDSLPGQVQSFFWADSTAALLWIRNEKPWK